MKTRRSVEAGRRSPFRQTLYFINIYLMAARRGAVPPGARREPQAAPSSRRAPRRSHRPGQDLPCPPRPCRGAAELRDSRPGGLPGRLFRVPVITRSQPLIKAAAVSPRGCSTRGGSSQPRDINQGQAEPCPALWSPSRGGGAHRGAAAPAPMTRPAGSGGAARRREVKWRRRPLPRGSERRRAATASPSGSGEPPERGRVPPAVG